MLSRALREQKITSTCHRSRQWNRKKTEELLYNLGHSAVDLYAHTMLRVDIRWHASLPDGPKILAANHPTTTDPIYLMGSLPEPVSYLITAASFDLPIIGHILRAAGHVPAIRDSAGATVDAIARKVEAGRSVVIFPEGALSPLCGGTHRPHSGIARVALRTGAPVIPIGIGLQRDRIHVRRAQIQGDEAVGHFYFRGPYAITVGRPLFFSGDVRDRVRVRAVADQIMKRIENLACESESRIQSAMPWKTSGLPFPTNANQFGLSAVVNNPGRLLK